MIGREHLRQGAEVDPQRHSVVKDPRIPAMAAIGVEDGIHLGTGHERLVDDSLHRFPCPRQEMRNAKGLIRQDAEEPVVERWDTVGNEACFLEYSFAGSKC